MQHDFFLVGGKQGIRMPERGARVGNPAIEKGLSSRNIFRVNPFRFAVLKRKQTEEKSLFRP